MVDLPFIYGAQYYRAPTPDSSCWEADLSVAANEGLRDIKFWVQWRVSHPEPGIFWYDDVDRLMDMAADHGLRVTLNIIYDVVPQWILNRYPENRMVRQTGEILRPAADASRQIGGANALCLNHCESRELRHEFTRQTVCRYREHPALSMWDVWNEPEQCMPLREPRLENLVCYCTACQHLFREWLRGKYGDLARLNRVWGRYEHSWNEVSPPLSCTCHMDMIDWRLFMLDTITCEAQWRINVVRALDPLHPTYCHVVPFIAGESWGLNQITCCDDFALGTQGDVFAGSVNLFPVQPVKIVSAARGRVCYNVESHVNAGSTASHPRPLTSERLRREFLAHIGLGIRGFMFWQFRAESLGMEAPAWGLLDPGGKPRLALGAAADFGVNLEPWTKAILSAPPPEPRVGIYLSAANEIFHWNTGRLGEYRRHIEGYSVFLYRNNVPFCYVTPHHLAEDLQGLDVLIIPALYACTAAEAATMGEWVGAGGVLVAEAHTAAYNLDTGRHEGDLPGLGLADRFGILEAEALAQGTAAGVRSPDGPALNGAPSSELLVALNGRLNSEAVPLTLSDGRIGVGVRCSASVVSARGTTLARFQDGLPALVRTPVSHGTVIYAGTYIGADLATPANPLSSFLRDVLSDHTSPTAGAVVSGSGWLHLDELRPTTGRPLYVVVGEGRTDVRWQAQGVLKGIFSGRTLEADHGTVLLSVENDLAELFVPVP